MPNYVKGGKKLKRFLHDAKREQRRMIEGGGMVVSVGFHDLVIASLAAEL